MSAATSWLQDYGASLAAFALFALCHSVGAQEPFKQALGRWTSPFLVTHFWRLLYCALSLWALYAGIASLHWLHHPQHDHWLIEYPPWLWQLLTLLHLLSVLLFYIAFLQSDYLEFLGLRQAWIGLRTLSGKPPPTPLRLFGTDRLCVRGIYGWVRHPMLAAGLLFLLTSGPSLNNLSYTLMYTSYMLIGGYYEERRLLRQFGADYTRYRQRVGAFLPRWSQLRPHRRD